MTKTYQEAGDVIQYTPGANITAGQVVAIGNTLGVALVDIASGKTGSVALKGVFSAPKVNGAHILQGETLSWDVSANSGAGAFDDNAATPATGDIGGATALAWESPADAATTMLVKFTGVPGTKT